MPYLLGSPGGVVSGGPAQVNLVEPLQEAAREAAKNGQREVSVYAKVRGRRGLLCTRAVKWCSACQCVLRTGCDVVRV